MIVFRNKGRIEEAAITTSGVSVKVIDNPIGVFGTGLKYAIAILLRNGCEISIWKGLKELRFTLKEKTIRGAKFNIVHMNGKALGFTDRMGLNWEMWQAFRELYCNAKDEDGSTSATTGGNLPDDPDLAPARGYTTIICKGKAIEDAYLQRHQTILMTSPIISLAGVDVHQGSSDYVFYKGIRVHKLDKPSMYTYNLTSPQMLTEDRTLLYPSIVGTRLARAIVGATWEPFLADVLTSDLNKNLYEFTLPYNLIRDEKPSPQFMEVAERLRLAKKLCSGALNLFQHYQDTMPGYKSPYIVELTEAESAIVDNAITLVQAKVSPWIAPGSDKLVIQFKSRTELGKVQATRTTITLDHKLIEQGHKKLAVHILEGVAMTRGGSIIEQLATLVMTGNFIARELVETLDDNEIPF